jgi:hypothetical protein
MLIASGAWIFHVAAMALAPLSIVQAVLSGGVVLLAVIAERTLGLGVWRRQWIGLALTAAGLVLLGVTLPAMHGAHSRFSLPGMISFEAGLIVTGTMLIMGRQMGASAHHHGYMLGAAAGIRFGVSDHLDQGDLRPDRQRRRARAALPVDGRDGCGLGRRLLRVGHKGLQDGDAVPVIAITSTAANVAGIVGGIIVFGDPISANPVALVAQCLAVVLVLVAAWLMPAPLRAVPAAV